MSLLKQRLTSVALQNEEMTEKGFEEEEEKEEERKGDFIWYTQAQIKEKQYISKELFTHSLESDSSLPAKWRRDYKNRKTCIQGSSKKLLVGRLQREEWGERPNPKSRHMRSLPASS